MELQPSATFRAPHGMVCSVDHLASGAGVAALRAGGSAADAAVATSAVLAVTTQHMCGMGGDLLAVVAGDGVAPVALNASGRAGSGADAERLRAEGHTVMPFRGDIRSVPVPGCVDGWLALHERFGRLPLADVLAPAIGYADGGFPASPTLAAAAPLVAGLPGAEDFAAPGGVRAGTIIRRPGVARALRAIVDGGRAGYYQGAFGNGLLALGGGEYAERDLADPLATWQPALGSPAWGTNLWTVPPNSQGYLTLAGAWIASGLDLPDPDDDRWAHLLIESARQAAFDRLDVLHEFADGAALVDPERLAPRRAAIHPDRAAVLGDRHRAGGTIALCAVDDDRLGVSLVQSNAGGFGAHLVVPEVGIFLQNRGIGFSLEPGHPAEYGPGRRPPHTLCPTAVTRTDGSLAAVLGTMGGDSQPQILLQVLARVLAGGHRGGGSRGDGSVAGGGPGGGSTAGAAIAAGRWALGDRDTGGGFDTWRRGGDVTVMIEGHAPAGWEEGLRRRGHRTRVTGGWEAGYGHAHLITVEEGHLTGATDPRPRSGAAFGY